MAGRPTNLTDAVFKAIVQSVRNGNYFSTSCEAAGVAEKTGLEWLRRGEGTDDREKTELYAEFANEILQAKAQAEQDMVSVLKKAAMGFEEVTTKQEVKPLEEGQKGKPKILSIEVKRTKKFDWRAALAYLGRTKKAKWGGNADDPDEGGSGPTIINLPQGGPWSDPAVSGDGGPDDG